MKPLRPLSCFSFKASLSAAVFAAAFAFAAPVSAGEKLVTLGTGGVTGVYYPAGGAICRLVNRGKREHGVRCVVESTGGSINNLESIAEGDLELGVVQSDWLYHAYKGDEIFEGQANTKLRVLFSLHSEPFIILSRKDSKINSFDGLKGKRINIGNPGSGMRATMEDLIRQKGWNDKTFADIREVKASDQASALCDRKIDAMIYAAGHPNGAVQQVSTMCDIRLTGVNGPQVDRFMSKYPFYSPATIPGNMYRGNTADVRTFGVRAVLVGSADMDEDEVYEIVKAVFDNLDNFKTLHPVFATLNAQEMVESALPIAPLHEGAARYYRERGWIK